METLTNYKGYYRDVKLAFKAIELEIIFQPIKPLDSNVERLFMYNMTPKVEEPKTTEVKVD